MFPGALCINCKTGWVLQKDGAWECRHDLFCPDYIKSAKGLQRIERGTGMKLQPARPVRQRWVQRTPCVCLDPPTHSEGCTGKSGLVIDPQHAGAGPSLLEKMWEELDSIVDRLKTRQEAEDGRDPGRAEMAAYFIAMFINPYSPDMQAVRKESMRRWKERSR